MKVKQLLITKIFIKGKTKMKSYEILVGVHTHTHTCRNLKEEKGVDEIYSKLAYIKFKNRSLLSKHIKNVYLVMTYFAVLDFKYQDRK